MPLLPLAGPTEIAQRAGVTKAAVFRWRQRYADFPEPVAVLRTGPVFWWPDVHAWLVETGRPVDAGWTLDQVSPDARKHLSAVIAVQQAQKEALQRSRDQAPPRYKGVVLSEDEWSRIAPVVLPPGRSHRFRDHRQVVEGMVFHYRTALPWSHLPGTFGPWHTVHMRYRRLCLDGTWDRVLSELHAQADSQGEIAWDIPLAAITKRVQQQDGTAPSSGTGGAEGTPAHPRGSVDNGSAAALG